MKKLLFLSNGHGEDLVAAEIIKRLPSAYSIKVFPLVGEGLIFEKLPVEIIGSRKKLPSGGFSFRNLPSLPRDLFSGLLGNLRSHWDTLNQQKGQLDLSIAIGDLIPLLGAQIVRAPFVFIGVNKSAYYSTFGYNYIPWEIWLIGRARKIYTRDKITAEALVKKGLTAQYLGNPLMDCIGIPRLVSHNRRIGFLPGTREEDLRQNLADFEKIADELLKFDRHLKFLLASPQPLPRFEVHPFEDVIYGSEIIIGLSGTGNEQAAGIGRPVISFPGRGFQYNARFARAQKELLGEALSLMPREPLKVAEEVWSLLNDQNRYQYMANTGKTRMGEAGAIENISQEIINLQNE